MKDILYPGKFWNWYFKLTFIRYLLRSHGWSPQNQKLVVINSAPLNLSFTLTILTKYSEDIADQIPLAFNIQSETTTQWDFLNFFLYLIEKKHLINGDYLIMDNAAIHCGLETISMIDFLCEISGNSIIIFK